MKRSRLQFTSISSLGASAITSSTATDTEAYVTDTTTTNISQMPLSDILQLLNERRIRYTPDATRSELEKLLLRHSSKSTSKSTSNSSASTTTTQQTDADNRDEPSSVPKNNVVDAVVLDESPQTEDAEHTNNGAYDTGYGGANRRSRSEEQEQYPPRRSQQRRQYHHQQQQQQNYDGSDKRRQARRSRRAQPRGTPINYELYSNYNQNSNNSNSKRSSTNPRTINTANNNQLDDFNLIKNYNSRHDQIYDNGIQILVMGFVEAGKTATQLAVDKVVDTVNPFARESRERDDDDDDSDSSWWYDEENGRNVLDVDVLEYSPQQRRYERRSRRGRGRRSNEYDEYGRRQEKDGRGGRRRRGRVGYDAYYAQSRGYDDRSSYHQSNEPDAMRREEDSGQDVSAEVHQSLPTSSTTNRFDTKSINSIPPPLDEASQSQQRRRVYDKSGGSSRPVYGLYQNDEREMDEQEIQDRVQRGHHRHDHTQEWRDRLRTKFDAALGLQSPTSDDDDETYYDSWKSQIQEMDDGRKEVLRGQMNGLSEDSTPDINADSDTRQPKPGSSDTSTGPTSNRRARMRAKSKHPPPPPSRVAKTSRSPRSRLDEVPFWREGGTIASLLFDTRPAPSSSSSSTPSGREGRRPRRRGSLEVSCHAVMCQLTAAY